MTPDELAIICRDALEVCSGAVTIELPRRAGGSERVRLAGRGSPLGELLCENSQHRAVARFDAAKVLAWLESAGLIGSSGRDGECQGCLSAAEGGDER